LGETGRFLHKKRAGGVAQGIGPEFKPQYHKKKKPKNLEAVTYFCLYKKNTAAGLQRLTPIILAA
jgi:hypothetical protein